MSRVLIWKNTSPNSEYDIFRQNDANEQLRAAFNAPGRNFGNRLWFQGLMSEIDTGENEYIFLNDSQTVDEINNSFDFIICPMANIFNPQYLQAIEDFAKIVSQLKIPFYIIACGIQAKNYDELDSLITNIGDASKRFMSAVYNCGGQFALRGNFTKEFFDRLGFPQAVVTGCPSLYQNGRNFKIERNADKSLKPAFNGNLRLLSKLQKAYPNSLYFDQDNFVRLIYDVNVATNIDLRFLYEFYRIYGTDAAQLLSEDRIKLIPDMKDWQSFLIEGEFDYSFGSRIHGNIMSILSGVPATVVAMDSRTREMAEFFGIPCLVKNDNKPITNNEFEEAYFTADYRVFNDKYTKNYDLFENFLKSNKIVSRINEKNIFFNNESTNTEYIGVNIEKFKKIYKKMKHRKPLLKMLQVASDIKNK